MTPGESSREAQVAEVERVLAAHVVRSLVWMYDGDWRWRCECDEAGSGLPTKRAAKDGFRTHVAQALIAAGLVLTDEWVVEERVEAGGRTEDGHVFLLPTKRSVERVTRTVTTATKTTPWRSSDE